jgi:hypothetical protein
MNVPKQIMHGDYENDQVFRIKFHRWVQQFWREKDLQIQSLMKEATVS